MISIIIANFNKSAFVGKAIRSALEQTAVSEIIVIDDDSTDGSLGVIDGIARKDTRVSYLAFTRNHGQSFCENRGLDRATGEYVMFLDSDDLLRPGCCAKRLAEAEASPHNDAWLFPMFTFADDADRPSGTWIPRPGDHLRNVLAHRLDWQLMQALWRRDFLLRIGGFDESFVRLTDVSLHTRALLAGARVRCHPDHEPDCLYRIAPDRYSWSVDELADRHVRGALHYVLTYRPEVRPDMRHLLVGTLLAALHRLIHWHRSGRLSADRFDALSSSLVDACESPFQRAVLRAYLVANRPVPFHVRGLTWAARRVLGLPEPSVGR